MKDRLTQKNQSTEKMLQIIEAMAEFMGPMRLQDISNSVHIPSSTVLRMLNSLIACGYVYQSEETQKYMLSMKFCKIGEAVRRQFNIIDVVRPYLVELSGKCQESACLAIDQNMEAVYIDVAEGADNVLKTLQRIGKSAPMHSTGVGKLLLLNYDANQFEEFVKTKGLTPLTKNTITTANNLKEELTKVKIQGYALDNEECEVGARCVAAPIRDYSGKIIACISVSGPVSRMTTSKINQIKSIILDTSTRISSELGFTLL